MDTRKLRVVKLIVGRLITCYYVIKVLIGLILVFFKNPTKPFWSYKTRAVPPECLTDKEHGVHKFVTVNGIKIHYVEKGDPSKPLMLFVHGFPEFWYSWRYQIKEFSKDYWTVAIDQRGYGDSDKPKSVDEYKIDKLADDIREVVLALGRKKFILVGHDWGAVVCWHFLGKYMEMIDSYIMMDAPSLQVADKHIWSSWKQFRKSWYIFYFQSPFLPELTIRAGDFFTFMAMKGDNKHNTLDEKDLEAYKYTFGQSDTLTSAINYYRANMTSDIKEMAPQTHKPPGLFLIGENDLYIDLEVGPLMQKQFQNLKFEIVPNANHFIQQHDPALVNRMMRDFLKK